LKLVKAAKIAMTGERLLMAEDFRGPHLKLLRAEQHIIELRTLLKSFMKLQSYEAIADFERHPGDISWIARGEDVFPHDEFSPIIGDIIHNLRDSLDLAVSILMRNVGEPDVNVYFPTASSHDAFQRSITRGRKTPNLPKNLIDVLSTRIQPYIGGHGELLRTLHDLAILDKHRLIVPTVFGAIQVRIDVPGWNVSFPSLTGPKPIRNGGIISRFPVSASFKAGQKAEVDLSIALDKRGGRLCGVEIEDACRKLMYVTTEAIEALETCLTP
jgi:hypothetical protein